MAWHIFSFYAAPPFYPPRPKTLEPRPKFACRSKISQNQNFIFVADRFSNLFDRLLLEPLPEIIFSLPRPLPIRSIKKGAVLRPLLNCKLFVKIYYLTLLALLLILLFTSNPAASRNIPEQPF